MRERALRKQILEQGTDEWLEWRNKGVGASEVSSVVGAAYTDRYGNSVGPKELWKTKSEAVKGESENKFMKWGKENEAPARDLYESLYDWSVPPCCVIHDDYDFVRASLDGLRGDNRLVVEIKCCGITNHKKLLEVQEIEDPLFRQQAFAFHFNYYRYQVLYQMLITQATLCHFVGYKHDMKESHKKLAVIELYPEPAEQEKLLNRVIEFWGYVERREPPPPDFCTPCHQFPNDVSIPPS
jgi:putative phage-type endonuclease